MAVITSLYGKFDPMSDYVLRRDLWKWSHGSELYDSLAVPGKCYQITF